MYSELPEVRMFIQTGKLFSFNWLPVALFQTKTLVSDVKLKLNKPSNRVEDRCQRIVCQSLIIFYYILTFYFVVTFPFCTGFYGYI